MELEDWTWGEILLAVQCRNRERRQQYQAISVIVREGALTAARALAGEQVPAVYDAFPFWEEQEQRELRLEHYRAMMQRLAGNGGNDE